MVERKSFLFSFCWDPFAWNSWFDVPLGGTFTYLWIWLYFSYCVFFFGSSYLGSFCWIICVDCDVGSCWSGDLKVYFSGFSFLLDVGWSKCGCQVFAGVFWFLAFAWYDLLWTENIQKFVFFFFLFPELLSFKDLIFIIYSFFSFWISASPIWRVCRNKELHLLHGYGRCFHLSR